VVHMGAVSATTERDADLIAAVNFRLSQTLWRWCAEQGKRFIYASSAATYGDGAQGFDDDGSTAALARLRPLNAYGWSKHLFDRWVAHGLAAGEAAPPQWAGLKFFNVYGPNEYHKGPMQSVVARNFASVRDGRPMQLFRSYRPEYADGGQLRDFIYVQDCVDVVLWLIDHADVSGLFNLGTGCARTWLDLATALFDAAAMPRAIEFIEMPATLRDKYQYFTQASMGRLRSVGYGRPFTSIEEGVRRYAREYLATAEPYR